MLGRNRELTLLSTMTADGAEGFLLFTGPRQSGKTLLLEVAAAEFGAKLIRLRRSETQWSYSGLSVIALSLGGPSQRSIEEQLALVKSERLHPLHLAEEFARQLRATAAPQPLLVDDIDLLDRESAAVLEHLVPRLPGTGLRIAATATSIGRDSVFAGYRQHPLRELSRADSVEVAAAAAPEGATREALMLLAVASAGRPGLIVSARLHPRERDGAEPIRIPLRVPSDVVPSTASLSPDDGGDLLRLIALAPFSSRTALIAASREQQDTLEDLVEHGVVDVSDDRVRIADPVERAALHATMEARQRRELHALGARIHLEPSPGIALWHRSFLEDGERLELDLLGFAEASAREGEVATAVEFAERALSLRSMLPGRGDLLSLLAEALFFQGEFTLARRYLGFGRALQHTPAGEIRAARVRMLCTFAIEHVVADSGGAALVRTHRARAPRDCSILLITLARLHLERWDIQPLEATLRRAVELQLVDSLAYSLLAMIAASDADLTGVSALVDDESERRVSRAVHDHATLPAEDAFLLCRVLILDERYAEARRILDSLMSGGPLALLLRESALELLTMLELRLGNRDRLEPALTLWTTLDLPEPSADAPRRYLIAAASAMLDQSPSDHVNELIERARRQCDADDNSTLRPHIAVLAGSRALIEGRYQDAIKELQRAKRSLASFRRNPSLLRADAELVEALWLAGRHDEARDELKGLEEATVEHPSRWAAAAAARAALVCAPSEELAEVAFEAALALEPDGLTHTHEHERLLAARRRRFEDTPPSREMEREPHSVPQRKGASALVSRLDVHELELAQLVWSGHRNREIAGILFVSQRTVELRLTRIYRKLGVDSRARLVALMSLLV